MQTIDIKKTKRSSIFKFTNLFSFNRTDIWFSFLIFFILVNISIILFSLYLYIQIDSGKIFIVEDSSALDAKIDKIDIEKMSNIIKDFDNRENQFNLLLQEKQIDIVDPSI